MLSPVTHHKYNLSRDIFSCFSCPWPVAEYVRWTNQPGCDMLRQYISTSVVPQPGTAQEHLSVSQLQSRGTQHWVRYNPAQNPQHFVVLCVWKVSLFVCQFLLQVCANTSCKMLRSPHVLSRSHRESKLPRAQLMHAIIAITSRYICNQHKSCPAVQNKLFYVLTDDYWIQLWLLNSQVNSNITIKILAKLHKRTGQQFYTILKRFDIKKSHS